MRAPEKGFTRELQVGIFVFTAILVIAAFSFRITDSPIFRRGTEVTVYLKDATGIFKSSKVKMAGIDIGAITDIELSAGKAKITLILNSGVEIPKNAIIVPRPMGILGDKYLEVVLPGKDAEIIEENMDSAPATESPHGFYRFIEGFSFVSRAFAQDHLPESVKSLPRLKDGDTLRGVDAPATLDDIARQMGVVGQDVKVISADIRRLVNENRDRIGQSIVSLNRILNKIDATLQGVDSTKLNTSINKLNDAVDRFQNSVERVNNITRKIDEGEGSVGKLINDSETVDQINRTLSTLNAALERTRRTQVFVDATSEYHLAPEASKTYFSLHFMPNEDTGYFGSVVIDETGTREKKIETITTNGGTPTVVETETRKPYKFRYSLQFTKRLPHIGAPIGVFESKGGAALDAFMWSDRIRLSLEAFDFGRSGNRAHVRAYAVLSFLQYFYVSVGGSDLIAKKVEGIAEPSFFGGLGLRFTDSDLKTLLAIPGIP